MSLRHRKKDANTKIDGNEKRGRNKDEKEEKPEKKRQGSQHDTKCAVHEHVKARSEMLATWQAESLKCELGVEHDVLTGANAS